jgi:hypothetical protein
MIRARAKALKWKNFRTTRAKCCARNRKDLVRLFVGPKLVAQSCPVNPMKFKLRPKFLFKGFQLRRKSPPTFWQFGLAVHDVIAARTLLAASGKLSAAEAHRMVDEKRLAAVRAQLACTEAILHGRGASAANAYFDVYQRAVDFNRKRLRNRRWRWPRRFRF